MRISDWSSDVCSSDLGQLLYNELQRILVGTDDLRLKAEEFREQRFGTLNIASFPAMATRILPGIVNRFIQGRPDVRPLLTSSGSRFLIEWVTAQTSDLDRKSDV